MSLNITIIAAVSPPIFDKSCNILKTQYPTDYSKRITCESGLNQIFCWDKAKKQEKVRKSHIAILMCL